MNREAYLMLTEFCPNRCEYCYIRNRHTRETMTMETVDKIMKEYNPYRIIFFGGEPLVELELMEKVLYKYYDKCKFQLVTSGSVNYEEFILDINKKYPFDEIQISWDGFNNQNRISADGINRQDDVYKKILWTIEQGTHFDIKCVISNDNVKFMHDTYKEFLRLLDYGVYGEFVVAHREYFSDDFFVEYEKQLPKCFDFKRICAEHLDKILAVIRKDFLFTSCDAGKYLVFRPNGDVSNCTILSQYPNPTQYNMDTLLTKCKHEKCQNCELYFMCDGGCRYERVAKFGDKWQVNYCEHTCKLNQLYYRVITNWLNELNNDDRKKLNEILLRYNNHQRNYMGVSK